MRDGKADAVLAASVFHFGTFSIRDVKTALQSLSCPHSPMTENPLYVQDWQKNPDGLLPAIVQDANTARVLMLGYMNAEALRRTQETG